MDVLVGGRCTNGYVDGRWMDKWLVMDRWTKAGWLAGLVGGGQVDGWWTVTGWLRSETPRPPLQARLEAYLAGEWRGTRLPSLLEIGDQGRSARPGLIIRAGV